VGELVRSQALYRGAAEPGECDLREHHGGRVSCAEAGHGQSAVTHAAIGITGGRTEDRDDVGGGRCHLRALSDGRHRCGGPLLQCLVDRLGGTAGAPALPPGGQDLGQRRDTTTAPPR